MIKHDFEQNNPNKVYIDSEYLGHNLVGISFIEITRGDIYSGVKVFRNTGGIDWKNPVHTFTDWKQAKKHIAEQLRQRG